MIARRLALAALLGLSLSACHDTGSAEQASGTRPSAPATSAPATSAPATPSPSGPPRFVQYAAPGVPGQQSRDGCLRSSADYPHLLAAALPVGQLADVSCSGADTGDVRRPQAPGVRPQLDAVTRGTDLVTIGLGGNDVDLFSRLVGGCFQKDPAAVTGSPCTDTLRPALPVALDTIERDLVEVVQAVREKAPHARIVLVGYPQIVPASGTCAEVPFAAADYPFARKVNQGLADAVARAAKASRTTYVDLWRASAGHDICAADPWINGISGPGAAPFHPFEVEQVTVARLVAAAL